MPWGTDDWCTPFVPDPCYWCKPAGWTDAGQAERNACPTHKARAQEVVAKLLAMAQRTTLEVLACSGDAALAKRELDSRAYNPPGTRGVYLISTGELMIQDTP